MKKLIVRAVLGLVGAMIVIIIIGGLNHWVLKVQIPKFMEGWLSCLMYCIIYFNILKEKF